VVEHAVPVVRHSRREADDLQCVRRGEAEHVVADIPASGG
jgi:hypothetical protein